MKGMIIKSTGSWYEILGEEKTHYKGRLRGVHKVKGLKVNNPIAVGDHVLFEEEPGIDSVVITHILPRKNYIIRKSVHKKGHSHLIASNLDQAILVATLTFPRTSLGFIDRFLVSAEAYRIPGIVIFNKKDILDAELLAYQKELMKMYESIGYRCIETSATTGEGIEEVKDLLNGKISLFSGHSGVGKSSLVNVIEPGVNIKTSEVSTFANKGVHTTTFAEMFELGKDTYIIDTPGIKELGLAEIEANELSHYFPEMRERLNECKFNNCRHLKEPGCAILRSVDEGKIAIPRYESYMSMLSDYDSHR
jgi:ribosome biogenesis GTPase / thiamine phosphate phosphatase